jgi:hypothetical protein
MRAHTRSRADQPRINQILTSKSAASQQQIISKSAVYSFLHWPHKILKIQSFNNQLSQIENTSMVN